MKPRRGILFNKCAGDRWERLVSREKHGKTEKTWACFQCWYRGGSKQENLEWGIIDEIIFLWVGTSIALKGEFALGTRVLRLLFVGVQCGFSSRRCFYLLPSIFSKCRHYNHLQNAKNFVVDYNFWKKRSFKIDTVNQKRTNRREACRTSMGIQLRLEITDLQWLCRVMVFPSALSSPV